MTKLYKKNGGTFIETNWTLEELERTAEVGAAYCVEALNLRQEKADLEYKLKCREDELAEITANRPARWDDETKRELQIILHLIAEIFKKHKIPFMLDLRNMRIKTGNCEKRLMVDTTPELLAVAGYYRYQIDQIHNRYIKHEKDFLEQKARYEGEIKALEAKNQIMQEQLENKEETENEKCK